MRLYAVPIVKNRWAYYCHSTIPSVSRLTKAVDWSSKKWELLDKAESGTWKKRLHEHGSNMMNQLDYQEWFFKSVPGKNDLEHSLDKVFVNHPTLLDGSLLEQQLQDLLKQRIPYHKKYMRYSAYWVPISCCFVIVPIVPNIPLAYNLFRLYSHYKAHKGAHHLMHLKTNGKVQYEIDPRLDSILNKINFVEAQDIVFPSKVKETFKESPNKPNLMGLEEDLDGVLNANDIKQLGENLKVPGLEVELNRARLQILKSIATERFRLEKEKTE